MAGSGAPGRARWRKATLVVGVPFLLLALIYAYRDIGSVVLPHPTRWGIAFLAAISFLVLSQMSWSALLPTGGTPIDRLTFYESQLVKYSPFGGVAQTASQALTLDRDTMSLGRAVRSVLLSKLTAAAGGAAWAPLLAVTGDFAVPQRAVLLFIGASVLLVHPVVLASLCRLAGRVRPALDISDEIPPVSTLLRSVMLGAAAVGVAGLGFAILAGADSEGPVAVLAAASGFALAWTVGLLAVPLPGGLGVRELVIGLLVGLPSGVTLVAALVLRVVQMVAEVALIAHGRFRTRGAVDRVEEVEHR